MGLMSTARPVVRYVWEHPSNRGARVRAMGRAVYGNPPDWAEMLTWKRLIRPGDLFVDVGANVGAYSVYLAELGATVEAIEPHPDAVARLRENVELNGAEVRGHEAVAAPQAGTAFITADRDDMNHVVPAGGLEVPALTLDDLLDGRHARGVKIDDEGFEREVLVGAVESRRTHRIDALQLEWNSGSLAVLGEDRGPVADLLRSRGYRLVRPDATGALQVVTDLRFTNDDLFAFAPDVCIPSGPL